MTNKAALLVDLDGTITDPASGIIASVQFALKTVGAAVPAANDLHWVIGPPLRVVFPKLGVAPDHVEHAVSLYRQNYDAGAMFDCTLHDGIEASLRALKIKGHRLFVATSKPHLFAAKIMAHFGLSDVFEQVHGAELDGRNDHKKDLIGHILKTHSLNPAHCLMVGDTAYDVEGARSHGIRTIGVTWGYGAENLAVAKPAVMITDPLALPEAVESLGCTAQ
ncbi:MAG: HAD hydrolase-like protein [Beijerinckiaceae bacterium]